MLFWVMVIVGLPPAPITLRVNEELNIADDIGPPEGTVGEAQFDEALTAETVGPKLKMAKPKATKASAINRTIVVAETLFRFNFMILDTRITRPVRR